MQLIYITAHCKQLIIFNMHILNVPDGRFFSLACSGVYNLHWLWSLDCVPAIQHCLLLDCWVSTLVLVHHACSSTLVHKPRTLKKCIVQ